MSWESSAEYYRLVNEATRQRLGGLHSADCVLRSVDCADVEQLQRAGSWEEAGALLAGEARALVRVGAELLMLCTNTMHKVADAIAAAVDVPFVHIADTTADAVRAAGIGRVGLLATAYAMEQDFYVGRLRDQHRLDVLVPEAADRRIVHNVIYDELCVGVVAPESARGVPPNHARARRARRRGHPSRLHRDRPASNAGRLTRTGLRHHPPARPTRRRPRP